MASLHQAVFERGWTVDEMQALLSGGAEGWRINEAAFLLMRKAADEAEILTLVTAVSQRRKGHARALMQQMLYAYPSLRVFLEVRVDNIAAIALYEVLGFQQIAVRERYYQNRDGSLCDAVIMQRDMS